MIFQFRKIVLIEKTINKTGTITNQENSAHCFGDNYFVDHQVKVLQDRISAR